MVKKLCEQFVPKIFWKFLVNWVHFAQIGKLFFDTHQLLQSVKIAKRYYSVVYWWKQGGFQLLKKDSLLFHSIRFKKLCSDKKKQWSSVFRNSYVVKVKILWVCDPKLLISILYTMSAIQFLLLIWIGLTLETKNLTGNSGDNCSTWAVHSDSMSPSQENLFHFIDFPPQSVTTIGEVFQLVYFSQTKRRHLRWKFCLSFSFYYMSAVANEEKNGKSLQGYVKQSFLL